ncbi:MAG TPA: DUF427 domain-containing protein [Solirubrobacteraceae bacterium]|nr:DUF427 domain-containing protein [Solirubrobacteraceae bacterium]
MTSQIKPNGATVSREPKIPSAEHPITIEPHDGRVVVRHGGTILADTRAALTLREADYPAVQYIPRADVNQSLLIESDTATYCPYKGDASYASLQLPDAVVADVLWFYGQPYPAVAQIRDHVAFYTDRVEVVADA